MDYLAGEHSIHAVCLFVHWQPLSENCCEPIRPLNSTELTLGAASCLSQDINAHVIQGNNVRIANGQT